MKIFTRVLFLVLIGGMVISCSHNASRSVAAETCHKQEWVDSEAYFDNYELCKGY